MAPAHSSLKRERSSSPDGNVSDSAHRASSVPVKKVRLSSRDSDNESVYIPGIGDDDGASVAASTDAETEDEVDGGVDAVLERAQQAAVSIPRRQLTAAEKRQKFNEKYASVSPEEALSTPNFLSYLALADHRLQRMSRRGGRPTHTSISKPPSSSPRATTVALCTVSSAGSE